MIKKVSLALLFLSIVSVSWSKEVSLQKAKMVAKTQLEITGTHMKMGMSNVALLHKNEFTDNQGDKHVAYYIFGNDNGFVIIAGDDKSVPVLGYSSVSSFNLKEAPAGLVKLLFNYTKEIKKIAVDENIQPTPEILNQWSLLCTGVIPNKQLNAVVPLLSTTWNQSPFYNMDCPDNSPAGCVATATSQIMKYYKKYFRPFSDKYKTETLSDGTKNVFRLSVIPLIEHIKIVATANPFNRDDDLYFTKRYTTLKLRNKFSY